MHWKMFSSTPGLYPLEANTGRQPIYSKYPNQQLSVKMKNDLSFYGTNIMDFWPTPQNYHMLYYKDSQNFTCSTHLPVISQTLFFFFNASFFCLFSERDEGREKERERNIVVPELHHSISSHTAPTGDLAQNPGMCPDWESKQRP